MVSTLYSVKFFIWQSGFPHCTLINTLICVGLLLIRDNPGRVLDASPEEVLLRDHDPGALDAGHLPLDVSVAMDNLGSMMPKLQQTGLATAFFRG